MDGLVPLKMMLMLMMIVWLVVSTPLKNMKVNGKDYTIYYGKMFQTTSQVYICVPPNKTTINLVISVNLAIHQLISSITQTWG